MILDKFLKNAIVGIVISCAVTPSILAATISSASLSDDKTTVQIAGSGFGSGPSVAIYDTFEHPNAQADAIISTDASVKGQWDLNEFYPAPYSDIGHSGSFSAKLKSGSKTMTQIVEHFPPSQEVFVSYWVRLAGPPYFPGDTPGARTFSSNSSWKFTWLINYDYDQLDSNICLPTYTGGGIIQIAGNDLNVVHIGTDWWSWDNWMRLSFWLQANPVNPTSPGRVVFEARSVDKGFHLKEYSKPIFDADGPPEKVFRKLNIPGWVRDINNESTDILYDDIYVAYGPGAVSRVEVGNASTYAGSTEMHVLPVENWSDSSITVGTLDFLKDSVAGMYAYVTDAEGKVNDQGIPFGSPPAQMPPPAVQ